MTEVNSSSTTIVTEETGQKIVTTTTTSEKNDGQTECKLSKEIGEKSEAEQDENLVNKTTIECEKTEEIIDGTTQKLVESHMETMKMTVKDGDAITTTTTQIKETTELVISNAQNNVEEKVNEVNEKLSQAKTTVEAGKEQLKDEVTKVKDEATRVKNQAAQSADHVKENLQKQARQFVNAESTVPISILVDENEEALHAVNKLRTMHGVQHLQWDLKLEESAKTWALKLAETGASAELSGIDNTGELVFVAKGTSECSRMVQAIFEWYKSVSQYKFQNSSMIPVSDTDRTFTQLVWNNTTHVGMCAMYREDKRITYIVAHFTPAGNYGDVRNYLEHVKKPVAGLPPKIPKIEEMISKDSDSPISNMASMFGILCNWCVSFEEKPEIKIAAARPIIKVTVSNDQDLPKEQKEENQSKENPTRENPTSDNPSEENPTQEVPTGDNPSEENPTQEGPTGGNPTEENPTQEALTDKNTSEENSTQETPTDENNSEENTLKDEATKSNESEQAASDEGKKE